LSATYKKGDIVLVKSPAGDSISPIHVKLTNRVIVKPSPGKRVGFRQTMDWPGYSGWEAEIVFQEEADHLRGEWGIPFQSPGDSTFVYDWCIIKKPRKPESLYEKETGKKKRKKRRVVRK